MEFYGTIGKSCQDESVIEEMFRVGMTGVRINMSHQSLEESKEWFASIQRAVEKCHIKPEILIDLQGPELRIGKLQDEVLLQAGEVFNFKEKIPFPTEIVPYLEEGQEILLDDGRLLLQVEAVKEARGEAEVFCKVLRGGTLLSRKSIALPGVTIPMPTLTEEDLKNIEGAKEAGVTGVMLPFVRGASDVRRLRQALREAEALHIRIFSKIENMAGVDALEEIVPESDMVIIARGDLGNGLPLWKLPALQKEISKKCKDAKKPFMVVTQLLHSMEHARIPTRAEVMDIYNAVLDGAGALMLTGETAAGDYPVEAMEYLVKTGREALKIWQEQ